MGETTSVSVSSEGAPAPEAPQVNVTAEAPNGVSISTDPQAADVPAPEATEEAAAPERPEWLDPKFESPEAMAKAYAELQARMGTQEAEEAPEAEEVLEGAGVTTEALQPFSEEYYSTGELTDESFAKLEAMGLGRDLVEAFMQGQKAVQSAELGKIYEQAGGEENYAQALAWAAQNMSAEEIESYNAQVENGDLATASMAVRGLMAMYQQSGGQDVEPKLLATEPAGKTGGVYESVAQLTADMRRPEYKTDPAFRAQVAQRLERSNIM
jgi:hypothetical protein